MSKATQLFAVLILLTFKSFSQTPFEKLDSLSNSIRVLQYTANGLKMNTETDGYELSFSENSFNYQISNRLADHSIYKKTGGRDVLYLTQKVDLSKAISAEIVMTDNDIGLVKLWFTNIKTELYSDGKKISEKQEEFLPFYFRRNDSNNILEQNQWRMMALVVELCNLTKIEQGLLTEEKASEMSQQFIQLIKANFNKMHDLEEFISNYPNSLYTNEVKSALERLNNKINKKHIAESKVILFGDSLCQQYHFKADLTVDQFKDFNSDIKNMHFVRYEYVNDFWGFPSTLYSKWYDYTLHRNVKKRVNKWIKGTKSFVVDDETRKVISCSIYLFEHLPPLDYHIAEYNKIKKYLIESFESNYVKEYTDGLKNPHIVLTIPKSEAGDAKEYFIKFSLDNSDYGHNVSLTFGTDSRVVLYGLTRRGD